MCLFCCGVQERVFRMAYPYKQTALRADYVRPVVQNDTPKTSRHVFRGSQLVTVLLDRDPRGFRSRSAACKFAKRLFRLGYIQSVFRVNNFEDSDLLYHWNDENGSPLSTWNNNLSTIMQPQSSYRADSVRSILTSRYAEELAARVDESASETGNPSRIQEKRHLKPGVGKQEKDSAYFSSIVVNRASDQTVVHNKPEITAKKPKDRLHLFKKRQIFPSQSKKQIAKMIQVDNRLDQRDDIAEKGLISSKPTMPQFSMASLEYELSSALPRTYASHASSATDSIALEQTTKRWKEHQSFSFSDNEKQLLEEMQRMKKEHQHILRTYEDRINKLMIKMHELRNIAEMLENSSTKSSPYGILTGKSLADGRRDGRSSVSDSNTLDPDEPPPLPPRPPKSTSICPNKAIIQPCRMMRSLGWTRIILSELGTPGSQLTIWHTMSEPRIDATALERDYNDEPEIGDINTTLHDDVIARRGRSRNMVSLIDRSKSKSVTSVTRILHWRLEEVINAVAMMKTSFLEQDGSEVILDVALSRREVDKVLHHVQRKGSNNLDVPEFIMYELSRIDHFREKADFLRLQKKLHDYLFDIDQQLKDLRTACEEVCASVHFKNLLETLLVIGNYMNGGTESGQADGYQLDVLNTLKNCESKTPGSHLLEQLLLLYCHTFTQDVTRYTLPEPSNMRHAAQVNLAEIHAALLELRQDICSLKKTILPLVRKEGVVLPDQVKQSTEMFFFKAEEHLSGQEQHFYDTREHFQRTIAYFMFSDNTDQICTKEFFHTLAVFLHDCKHNWQNVQRKLSQQRFWSCYQQEQRHRDGAPPVPPKPPGGLLDSDSLDRGSLFSGSTEDLLKAPIVNRISKPAWATSMTDICKVSTKQEDHLDMSILDTTQNTLEKSRSPPKKIVATPPSNEDVHRPIPTPPKSTSSTDSPYPLILNQPNYENHTAQQFTPFPDLTQSVTNTGTLNEFYESTHGRLPESQPHQSGELISNGHGKKNGFSFKSWLKKEAAASKESRCANERVNEQHHMYQNQEKLTTFNKFKASVAQKFGNNNYNGKPDQQLDGNRYANAHILASESYNRPVYDNTTPLSIHDDGLRKGTNANPAPRSRSRSRSPKSARSAPETLISSHLQSGRRNSDVAAEEEVAFYSTRYPEKPNLPNQKLQKLELINNDSHPHHQQEHQHHHNQAHTSQYNTTNSYVNGSIPTTFASYVPSADLNNNANVATKHRPRKTATDKCTALTFGSNINISDTYEKYDNLNSKKLRHIGDSQQTGYRNVEQTPMYENQQGRTGHSAMYNTPTSYPRSVTGSSHYPEQANPGLDNYLLMSVSEDDSRRPVKPPRSEQRCATKQHSPGNTQRGHGHHYHRHTDPSPPKYQYYSPNQDSSQPPSEQPWQQRDSHQRDSRSLPDGKSISSLIQRFETTDSTPGSEREPVFHGKSAVMTSTPVTHRKHTQLSFAPQEAHHGYPRAEVPVASIAPQSRHEDHHRQHQPFPLLDSVMRAASAYSHGTRTDNRISSVVTSHQQLSPYSRTDQLHSSAPPPYSTSKNTHASSNPMSQHSPATAQPISQYASTPAQPLSQYASAPAQPLSQHACTPLQPLSQYNHVPSHTMSHYVPPASHYGLQSQPRSSQDDYYKDQLRRAAKSTSALDSYPKPTHQQTSQQTPTCATQSTHFYKQTYMREGGVTV